MKKIIFLANCNSPHLDRWVDLLDMLNIEVEIWSVHNCKNNKKRKKVIPDALGFLPVIFQYILAGVLLRFRNVEGVFHAHNTSGYGLMAFLSGKEYIITTYGSEIYSTNKKNILYRSLLKKILDKSLLITSTSKEMKNCLEKEFSIHSEKIRNFSLGLDTDLFYPKKRVDKKTKVWIINRRMHPHYNTLETINGFINYINNGNLGKLIVILGDYDHNYYEKIKSLFDFEKYKKNIQIIDKFLDRKDLSSFLQISNFSISTPLTDQLSSSILESIACGAVPILFNLNSYEEIITNQSCIVMKHRTTEAFEEIFLKTSKMKTEQVSKIAIKGVQYIIENESSKSVLPKVNSLYRGLLCPSGKN